MTRLHTLRYSKLVDASVEYWCSDNRSGSNSKSWLGLRVVGWAAGTTYLPGVKGGRCHMFYIYYTVAWQAATALAVTSWDISIAVATHTTSH